MAGHLLANLLIKLHSTWRRPSSTAFSVIKLFHDHDKAMPFCAACGPGSTWVPERPFGAQMSGHIPVSSAQLEVHARTAGP